MDKIILFVSDKKVYYINFGVFYVVCMLLKFFERNFY